MKSLESKNEEKRTGLSYFSMIKSPYQIQSAKPDELESPLKLIPIGKKTLINKKKEFSRNKQQTEIIQTK